MGGRRTFGFGCGRVNVKMVYCCGPKGKRVRNLILFGLQLQGFPAILYMQEGTLQFAVTLHATHDDMC